MNGKNIPIYKISVNERRPKTYATITPVEDEPNESIIVKDEVTKSALRLETQRRITLSGDAQGAVLFDGSSDVVMKIDVKNARYAIKDSQGNVISDTYATKSELSKYALKKDIDERLNYIEKVLYATKNAVNNSLRREDVEDLFSNGESNSDGGIIAGEGDIDNMFGSDTSTQNTGNDTNTSTSGDGDDMATEDDIDALFG